MIKFFSHVKYQQIKPEIDDSKYNIWNSSSWWFPVETGQLVMFPSSTTHQVDTKKGNNTRVSLAFNTFYKGAVGSNSNLTELILWFYSDITLWWVQRTPPHTTRCILYKDLYYVFWRITFCQFTICRSRV